MKQQQKPKLSESRESVLSHLEAEIMRIEKRGPKFMPATEDTGMAGMPAQSMLSTGHREADRLIAGTAAAALHEVRAPLSVDAAAGAGFALGLGLRTVQDASQVFWIAEEQAILEAGRPYGPGLSALGMQAGEVIHVFVRRTADALWAAGEIAACRGAGLCILELRGNPRGADLAFSRRLALRARESGVPVILLRQGGSEEASAALTRWQVSPSPSDPGATGRKWVGPPAFAVTLEKCRGGRSGRWIMEWKSDERVFAPFGSGIEIAAGSSSTSRHGAPATGGALAPLSVGEPAEPFDRPHRQVAQGAGMAARRAG